MTINFPGPYQLRYFYTVDGRPHSQRLNCDVYTAPTPGEAFTTIQLKDKTGASRIASVEALAWAPLIAAFIQVGHGNVGHVELWKFEAGTNNASFVSTYTLGTVGTGAGTVYPASEVVFSFRTTEGGILRVKFYDTNYGSAAPQTAPTDAALTNVRDKVLNTNNVILGQDTSYPFGFIKVGTGFNEALWRKVYRP